MSEPVPFAELHCLSNFSFLRGASHPEELVRSAASLGYTALALTDECSLGGVVRAWQAIRDEQLNIHLIIGSEFRAQGLHLVLLAPNHAAYTQLCQLITTARQRAEKGDYELDPKDLDKDSLDQCLALWHPNDPDSAEPDWATRLHSAFPERLWIAVSHHLTPVAQTRLRQRLARARAEQLPAVAVNQVHMHSARRQMLQDTLTAIRLGCTVQDAGFQLHSNAERHLRPWSELCQYYPPGLLAESLRIARRCTFDLGTLQYRYPVELVPSGHSASSWLRQLTREGERRRYPQGTPLPVQASLRKELALISELQYEHFFLTIEDLVRFARTRGILCQGRGSAANSAVCYCLGITEVDPARSTLLFERFISRERNEPPDIDVDFEHERREEVIQYLYTKYGRHRAALAATVITYRRRSAVRDVGKALGYTQAQLTHWLQQLDRHDSQALQSGQLAARMQTEHPLGRRFLHLVEAIIGFPRHLSQHVGGFVIAARNLNELVPVENAAMADRTLIQWDKDDLEALGLLKVDVLALGMLTALRKTLDLCTGFYGQPWRIEQIPDNDPDTYRMLQKADSLGVFQVESRAQMSMLPRLKPACFYDLVVQVAIVRPGPIQGDMVHPYLAHREFPEDVRYPTPGIRRVLERTHGVPIFQEQVIALAVEAAGFSPGEADQLRRAMASWKRHGHMESLQQRLVDGMLAHGHSRDFAQRLCRQIQGFGDYGFPESHAASFAILAYQSAWLKCHQPAAFFAALLNSQPMGFYAPAQLLQDAQRQGVTLLPVDINRSLWDHSLEPDPAQPSTPALRLGLRQVSGLRQSAFNALLLQRPPEGFANLAAIQATRTLDTGQWAALAASDALHDLAGHRYQAHWDVLGQVPETPLFQPELFGDENLAFTPPSEGQNILTDYQTLGLTLGRHPLALLRERQQLHTALTAAAIQQHPAPARVTVCGLVIGRQRPGTAKGVTFVSLEDETGLVNVIVWRQLAQRQRQALLLSRLLQVTGTLQREGDVLHVIARTLRDRSDLLGQLPVKSRDFH